MSNKNITCRTFEMPSTPPHKNLRKRFGAAFVSGCLALTMCPALALAQPGDAFDQNGAPDQAMQAQGQQFGFGGDQQFGDPGAFQQAGMPFDGQEPGQGGQEPGQDGMAQPPAQDNGDQGQRAEAPSNGNGQAPDANGEGQQPDAGLPESAPSGEFGQMSDAPFDLGGFQMRSDAIDGQIRQLLADAFGISAFMQDQAPEDVGMQGQAPEGVNSDEFGGSGDMRMPGNKEEAPEIPEGEVNVQQVIDAARDILREYGSEDLEARLADPEFASTLQSYAKVTTEQRLADFANNVRPTMENPADLPAPEGDGDEPSLPLEEEAEAQAGDSVLSQIVKLVLDVFGYAA